MGPGFLFKESLDNMAGHPKLENPKCGRNSPSKIREKRKRKRKEKSSHPIPDPTPVRSCVENPIGPKTTLRLVYPHAPLVVRLVRKALD